jgi:hypothetical protein
VTGNVARHKKVNVARHKKKKRNVARHKKVLCEATKREFERQKPATKNKENNTLATH